MISMLQCFQQLSTRKRLEVSTPSTPLPSSVIHGFRQTVLRSPRRSLRQALPRIQGPKPEAVHQPGAHHPPHQAALGCPSNQHVQAVGIRIRNGLKILNQTISRDRCLSSQFTKRQHTELVWPRRRVHLLGMIMLVK